MWGTTREALSAIDVEVEKYRWNLRLFKGEQSRLFVGGGRGGRHF